MVLKKRKKSKLLEVEKDSSAKMRKDLKFYLYEKLLKDFFKSFIK